MKIKQLLSHNQIRKLNNVRNMKRIKKYSQKRKLIISFQNHAETFSNKISKTLQIRIIKNKKLKKNIIIRVNYKR